MVDLPKFTQPVSEEVGLHSRGFCFFATRENIRISYQPFSEDLVEIHLPDLLFGNRVSRTWDTGRISFGEMQRSGTAQNTDVGRGALTEGAERERQLVRGSAQ